MSDSNFNSTAPIFEWTAFGHLYSYSNWGELLGGSYVMVAHLVFLFLFLRVTYGMITNRDEETGKRMDPSLWILFLLYGIAGLYVASFIWPLLIVWLVIGICVTDGTWQMELLFGVKKKKTQMAATAIDFPIPNPKRQPRRRIFQKLREQWLAPSIPASSAHKAKPPAPSFHSTASVKPLPLSSLPSENKGVQLIHNAPTYVEPSIIVKTPESTKSSVGAPVSWNYAYASQEGVIPQLPQSQTVVREISPNQVMHLNHRIMQTELYKLIVAATRSIPGAIVECEVGGIDIRIWLPEQTIYIEIKTNTPARLAIREAIGQLLEYVWVDRQRHSDRPAMLVTIAPEEADLETKAYLLDLENRYRVPVKYIAYKLGSYQFSWEHMISPSVR